MKQALKIRTFFVISLTFHFFLFLPRNHYEQKPKIIHYSVYLSSYHKKKPKNKKINKASFRKNRKNIPHPSQKNKISKNQLINLISKDIYKYISQLPVHIKKRLPKLIHLTIIISPNGNTKIKQSTFNLINNAIKKQYPNILKENIILKINIRTTISTN